MRISDGLPARPEINRQRKHSLASQITGPLLGLGYVVVLPIAGLIGALLLCGYCAEQLLLALGRRAVHMSPRSSNR